MNRFAALSVDRTQDGGLYDLDSGCEGGLNLVDHDQYVVVKSKGKRLRMSAGSGHESELCDLSSFSTLNTDEKLCEIMAKLSVNQNKIQTVENKLDMLMRMESRLFRAETVILSHDDRLKLLEYKSIDNEARNRRNNLLFKGIPEERNEDCFHRVEIFLRENFHISDKLYMHRAHRLGRFSLNKIRPIIVAFRDYGDTELIMSRAKQLRGTPYGVTRDYPPEIVKARQKNWPEYKKMKQQMSSNDQISISFPAKLIVNREVKVDLFPDWNRIMKGSRISVTEQYMDSSQTGFTTQRQDVETIYKQTVNQQINAQDSEFIIADDSSECSTTEYMESQELIDNHHEYVPLESEHVLTETNKTNNTNNTSNKNCNQDVTSLSSTPLQVAEQLLRNKNTIDEVFKESESCIKSPSLTDISTPNENQVQNKGASAENPENSVKKVTVKRSDNSKTHTSKTTIQLSPKLNTDTINTQLSQKPAKDQDKTGRASRRDTMKQTDLKSRSEPQRTQSTQRRDPSRVVGQSDTAQA